MKNIVLGVAALGVSLACHAQAIDKPAVKAGDTWTYLDTNETNQNGWKQTRNELVVDRVTSSLIYYTVKPAGSPQAPRDFFMQPDWSRLRNINGKDTVVFQPLDFPLAPGKTWSTKYKDPQPGKNFRWEEWETKYTVIGYETIEVPAGKFNAIKIEAEGHWTGEIEPSRTVSQATQANGQGVTMVTQVQNSSTIIAGGRLSNTMWYAPEVKRWVKAVEEIYSSRGERTSRHIGELQSFKVSQ